MKTESLAYLSRMRKVRPSDYFAGAIKDSVMRGLTPKRLKKRIRVQLEIQHAEFWAKVRS